MWYRNSEDKRAGCYALVENGPVKGYNAQVPLKELKHEVRLMDAVADVRQTQTYVNTSSSVMDIMYVFPLHSSAALYQFEIHFASRVTKGVVLEKQEAEEAFKKAQEEGKTAAVGQRHYTASERIKVKLGNVNAGETIKIVLGYSHPVSLAYNALYQYRASTALTPRYLSSTSGQSAIISSLPNAKQVIGACPWNLRVTIQSENQPKQCFSLSHDIMQVKNLKKNEWSYEFSHKKVLPDKDFVLFYGFNNFEKPTYYAHNTDQSTTAVVSMIPQFNGVRLSQVAKKVKKNQKQEVSLDISKSEYVFFLDRSGSMHGARIERAKLALVIFLKSLPEDSYFNVISFGSEYDCMFPESVKNETQTMTKAILRVQKMTADLGGTQVLKPIRKGVGSEPIKGYVRQMFLLTDGAVSNVKQVINFVSSHTKTARLHCIGIGDDCSSQLVKGAATHGKGYCCFIPDEEEPQNKIVKLLEDSLTPLITDFKVEFDQSQVESITPSPKDVPYLLRNDLAQFYIQFKGRQTSLFRVHLSYKDLSGKYIKQEVTINPLFTECRGIEALASMHIIQALQNVVNYEDQNQDRIYYVKKIDKDKIKERIVEESVKRQVLSDYTSFLCVDQETADNLTQSTLAGKRVKYNIKTMRPGDMQIAVDGLLPGSVDQGSESYEDQCAFFAVKERAQSSIVDNTQEEKNFDKPNRPFPFYVSLGPDKVKSIQGVKPYQDTSIRNCFKLMKLQNADGSWNGDQTFVRSLFNRRDVEQFTHQCKKVDKQLFYTFLAWAYFQQYIKYNEEYSLIKKKAKNYIIKKDPSSWTKMEQCYKKIFDKK